ncbi:hypothetical protein PROFUN_15276 [Planoprotostelium fungivorum]|uniref:Uncharacterized protein n=1 Tax=Planoprotostelium fungivorum TaxID=1890364 RepID=A0A2P6MXE6_9EUKA|nr:hypothetical protein PROFUN_15276 [Planoprotostelium fungivorum]
MSRFVRTALTHRVNTAGAFYNRGLKGFEVPHVEVHTPSPKFSFQHQTLRNLNNNRTTLIRFVDVPKHKPQASIPWAAVTPAGSDPHHH